MLYSLLAGLGTAGVFVLIALGFTTLLRITDIVNLAHGSFVLGGMFLIVTLVNDFGLNYYAAIPVATVVGAAAAALLYVVLFRRTREVGHQHQIVVTLLLLSICQVVFSVIYGTEHVAPDMKIVSWEVLGVEIRREKVVAFIVALIVSAALYAIFRWTTIGKAIEIAGKHEQGARAVGLPVERFYAGVFVGGSALAFLAGALVVGTTSVDPYGGLSFLVTAVLIAIVARLNFIGTIAVALLYGVGNEFLQYWTGSQEVATVLVYSALMVAMAATQPIVGLQAKLGGHHARRLAQTGRGVA